MARSPSTSDPDKFVYYHYTPSLAAAILFTLLFALTTLLHMFQAARKRAWFLAPFIIGGIFQATGYIGRILSSQNSDTLGPFIMQALLLLVAPALYAATIYMVLGRIVLLTDGTRFSVIRPAWLTKLFVAGDVLSFLSQGAGGGISAGKTQAKRDLGRKIILVGLWLQIAFFGLFVLVAVLFQHRGRAHLRCIAATVPWRRHLLALYATSGLILLRSVFRVVEYVQGNAGYLMRHEVFLYVFDALLMFVVMVIMNVVHPGDIAPLPRKKEDGEGKKELREVDSSGERATV